MKLKSSFFITFFICIGIAHNAIHAQTWDEAKKNFERTYTLMQIDSAYIYAEQAIKIAENEFGKSDMKYATALNNLALANKGKGNFAEAERLFKESIALKESISGNKTQSYANSINALAGLYNDLGRFSEAEPLFNDALEIYKNTVGTKNAAYIRTQKNLANLYASTGVFDKAEIMYTNTLEGFKELLGEKHIETIKCMNGLAILYVNMGLYEKAEPIFIASLENMKAITGEQNADYARTLSSLANVYDRLGNYEKAEPLYEKVIEIQKATIGTQHPDYGKTLNSLASLYNNLEYYDKAEQLFNEALKLKKNTMGEKTLSYAFSLNGIARMLISVGDFEQAEEKLLEALTIRKEILTEKHPDYINNISDLAALYYEMKQFDKAETYFIEMAKLRLIQIRENFAFLSENEKEKYLMLFRQDFDRFNNLVALKYKESPKLVEASFNNQLAMKGLIFNSNVQLRNKILSGNNTELINKYNEWLKIKELIGKIGQADKESSDLAKINVDSLEKLADKMEKSISFMSADFAEQLKASNITWQDVQNSLKQDEAVIEFIEYQHYQDKHFLDTSSYIAMVLLPDGQSPHYFYLCNNERLSKLLLMNNAAKTNEYVVNSTINKRLYKTIWQPFESLLEGKTTVYLSLAGLLNKISFVILKDDKEKILLDKYDIKYINSSRIIANPAKENNTSNNTIALFGGIKFDLTTADYTNLAKSLNKTVSVTPIEKPNSLEPWEYLEGTLAEVNSIDKSFQKLGWKTSIFKDYYASEESFKSLQGTQSPAIIHLASHGFSLPDPQIKSKRKNIKEQQGANVFYNNQNPLYRSGIILAGGNRVWLGGNPVEGLEDGILTAYEVANTYLGGTELVVLSACGTGLGDIKGGEGVYGLQRSFQIAGAKSVIISLWSVPDLETFTLMDLFYQNFVKTGDLHNSLREAQKQMSKKYKPEDWAAFIMLE